MNATRLRQSLRDALRGVRFVYSQEQNFRLQLWVGILLLGVMFVLGVRVYEKIILLLLIVSVLVLELLNTALERLADVMKPRLLPHVGIIKDILAGMVLLGSVGAAIIGAVILWPYLYPLILSIATAL